MRGNDQHYLCTLRGEARLRFKSEFEQELLMKEKIIYALGFFDGVHLGHQALLSACRELAAEYGCQTGVVTFTAHPESLVLGKAPLLLCSPADRRQLLQAQGIGHVLELTFDEGLRTMPWQDFFHMLTTKYGAGGLVCGDDFRFGYRGEGNAALLKAACQQANIPCTVVPEQLLDGMRVSSTHIRQLLENGNMIEANRFLGHRHVLSGQVVPGRGLGHTIGIPTANLQVQPGVMLPKNGVYACATVIDGKKYPAVTNIGSRPTVDGHHVTVEPWILDFDGDLYGKTVSLQFCAYLREEEKFPSLEALKAQILKDAGKTKKIFENT